FAEAGGVQVIGECGCDIKRRGCEQTVLGILIVIVLRRLFEVETAALHCRVETWVWCKAKCAGAFDILETDFHIDFASIPYKTKSHRTAIERLLASQTLKV